MSDAIQAFGKDGICAVCKRNPVNRWCDFVMSYDNATIFLRDYKDFINVNEKSYDTCDLPMCDKCAANVGRDRDMCPYHKGLFDKRKLPDEYQRIRASRERTKIAYEGLEVSP
jgi:hypothetical protein